MPHQPDANITLKWPKIQVNYRKQRKGVTEISYFINIIKFILQVLKSVAKTTSKTCNLQGSVKVTQDCHLLCSPQQLVFYAVQIPSTAHSHYFCLQTAVFIGKYVHTCIQDHDSSTYSRLRQGKVLHVILSTISYFSPVFISLC